MRTARRAALVVTAMVAVGLTALSATASATIKSDSNGTFGATASFATTGSSTFTIGTNSVTCTTWTLTGTTLGSSISIVAAGTTWSNCTYNIGGITGSATVTDAGTWTITVTGSVGGGSFSLSLDNGTMTITAATCTITIWPPTTTYSGLAWTSATHSLTFNVNGMSYTASGFLCPLPGVGNGGWSTSFSEPTLTVS